MTSEGPRHANEDPAEYGAALWPGPFRDQPAEPDDVEPDELRHPFMSGARGSATVPTARASASVPTPPGRPQAYEPQPYAPPSGAAVPAPRATGLAQVPEAALLPAHQLPPLPLPVPRVYGRPTVPTLPAEPHRPASIPMQAGPRGSAATAPAAHPPPQAFAAAQGIAAPPSSGALPGPAGLPSAATPPGYTAPQSAPSGQPFRVPDWQSDDDHTPPDGSGSHTGLLIAVGAVVLVAVVGLVAFLWPRGDEGAGFTVNTCVRQSGTSAIAADCAEAGTFTIVARVANKDQCPDAQQPYVELGTGAQRILCLAPANSGTPTTTGSSGGPAPGTT